MSLAACTGSVFPLGGFCPHGRPRYAWLGCPASAPLTGPLRIARSGAEWGHACSHLHEPRRIEAGERPDPSLREPTDAIVRVVLACVCGSDLWYFRGDSEFAPGPI